MEPAAGIYEFATFRLDERQHLLFNGDQAVALSPKAFDTLLALVRRKGEVVGRQELIDEVWPGTFVEDGGLSRNISILRKLLAGNDSDQKFIETVPKRGYRFVAPVRNPAPPPLVLPATEATVSIAPPKETARPRVLLLVGVIVAVITGVTAWMLYRPGQATEITGRIMVLPFENLTRQEADDWLSSALADSLTYGLRNADGITLVNRERIDEVYQEQRVKEAGTISPELIRALSQRFDVQHYVHGSYQRVGDQLRVVAQLVDARSGDIKLQESTTDRFADIFTIEDQLATRLAEAINVRPDNTPVSGTRSVDALRAFSEAKSAYAVVDFGRALLLLTRAVAIDPNYADAWALAAKAHIRTVTGINFVGQDTASHLAAAIAAATRALELNPQLYEGHLALALVHRQGNHVDEWRAAALKAIELNPRGAEAHVLYADSYAETPSFGCTRDRNPEMADQYFAKGIELDPLYAVAHGGRASNRMFGARFEESLAAVERGLAITPSSSQLAARKILALVPLGRQVDKSLRAHLGTVNVLTTFAGALADLQTPDTKSAGLATFDQVDAMLNRIPAADLDISAAYYYLALGYSDRALPRLEHAIAIDSGCAGYIAASPLFVPFRDNAAVAKFFRMRSATGKAG